MGFLDKIFEYTKHIQDVEESIHANKQDFLEIYERNLQLEKEITERRKELQVTNQRMLSLQHVWDMLNSSRPLSSIFNSIVKTLQGDLGYVHCMVIKIEKTENEKTLRILSQSHTEFASKLEKALGDVETATLIYPETGVFVDSLTEKVIKQTTDYRSSLRPILKCIDEDKFRTLLANPQSRSMISIPLKTQGNDFGWLVVFSTRELAEDAELDFLKTFSQQIELAITIADLFQVVKNQAVTDPLTTLYNRRYFEEFLKSEVTRAERTRQPFTLIGLDLDHLKQINDKYGHYYGDLAIKTVAEAMKKNARSIDVAARIGGEEFNILLPGVDSAGGVIAAERIRTAIESCKLDQIGHVTASIGVATFLEHSDNADELLELVDQAMYKAKRNGRNQVKLAKAMTETSWQEIAIDVFVKILSKHQVHVPAELAQELCEKLSTNNENQKSKAKEMLYNVSDILTQTYNPSHQKGITKEKIKIATKLAKIFNLSEEEINKLRIATTLYDIGNLMLPQELLLKSEPLTDDEKEKIKAHPVIAAREILEPISSVQDIIPIIEAHHENWDGTGYPGKAAGQEIPLSSQIILILDAYFALIEPRSYRKALKPADAINSIKEDAGKKWNNSLVKEFCSLMEKYVETDDNEDIND